MESLVLSLLLRTPATKGHAMVSTIRDKILYCSELFEQAPAEDSEIKDAHKRFKKWNTNYTAGRAGTFSLDERLRDAPDVKDATLDTLDNLVTALKCPTLTPFRVWNMCACPTRSYAYRLVPLSGAESSVDRASMHEAVESLEYISLLLEIPASVDRYEKAKYVNVDHFIPIDKSHIDERFPKADPVLRERLLQGVLSRRRALRYAQEHKEELAKEAPCPQDEEEDENDDETMSDISDSSSLCSNMSIRVRPMPLAGQEGKPFECPYCFSMIEAENREEWKIHVSSDMLPYVCTFTDCEEPDRLFGSRAEWYLHEFNYHRRTWFCILGCLEKFDSKSAFEAHWSVAHRESGGVARAEELGAHSTRLPGPESQTSTWCPMCHDEIRDPGRVMKHIGRHQAQLGLRPLRSMVYFDDEDDQEGNEENGEDGAEMSDEEGKVPDNPAPSQDAAGSDSPPPGSTETLPSFDREDYTVGWICASQEGLDTAVACLDAKHKAVPRIPRGGHDYAFGEINGHHIVIGCADIRGNRQTSVATLAAMMRENFPGIKLCLSVSIGGAVPSGDQNIRLGDVAVGSPGVLGLGMDGVLQPARPGYAAPMLLRRAASGLWVNSEMDGPTLGRDMRSIMSKRCQQWRDCYSRPDSSSDDDGPAVHRGWIASGTTMLTSADDRKALADRKDVVCFEMEAAKLMEVSELAEGFPVMLIRGICDYCDTHKNEQWQRYAAMSAAVYARALLRHISPPEIKQSPKHPSS